MVILGVALATPLVAIVKIFNYDNNEPFHERCGVNILTPDRCCRHLSTLAADRDIGRWGFFIDTNKS